MKLHQCVIRIVGALVIGLASLVPGSGAESATDPLVEEAHALVKAKNYPDAIKAYTKAIEAEPKDARRYLFRGIAYSMTADWKECLADFGKGIELEPRSQELLTARAFARLQTDEFELAEKDFATLDDIEKDAGKKARFGLAQRFLRRARNNLMSKNGDKKAALADYNRVLAIAPTNDIILFERGCAYHDLNDHKRALADFDRVIKINGDISKYGDSHHNRAKVKRALGDHQGAAEDEAEAKRRAPAKESSGDPAGEDSPPPPK